jgi:ubiquinone/menaquinone biosynthesis C-methylase UbiE
VLQIFPGKSPWIPTDLHLQNTKFARNGICLKKTTLSKADVLSGYDAVSTLYPFVPSLSHWRAWEYAAYSRWRLYGRVLDIGCGDGQFFRLIWPLIQDVIGLDIDLTAAGAGKKSGVYRTVHITSADQIPEPDESFDCIFANCSLEHMENIDEVLAEIFRCLKPGGTLLCSVITECFTQWSVLPNFLDMAGYNDTAKRLQNEFINYHRLKNTFSTEEWRTKLADTGVVAEEYIPIMPQFNSGFFLVVEAFWHMNLTRGGEGGDIIHPFLSTFQSFPHAFRKIIEGLLDMEVNWHECSGVVFSGRKIG